jgi:hypothetical protein
MGTNTYITGSRFGDHTDKQTWQDRRGTKQEGRYHIISDGEQTEHSKASRAAKAESQQKTALEKIIRLKYNNHFNSTGGASFHTDHINLCIAVVQITNGKSSEIFCPSLVGDRDPVNKWARKGTLNRALFIMPRNVTEGVTFYIHLRRNVLDMYVGNNESAPTGALGRA